MTQHVDSRSGGGAPEYLTPAAAARLLRVSPKTITRWAREGKVPSVTTLGGHRRFPRQVIERLAEDALRDMSAEDADRAT